MPTEGKTIKVRERRPVHTGQGGGLSDKVEVRVVEVPDTYELSAFAEEVPGNTPVSDWEEVK